MFWHSEHSSTSQPVSVFAHVQGRVEGPVENPERLHSKSKRESCSNALLAYSLHAKFIFTMIIK